MERGRTLRGGGVLEPIERLGAGTGRLVTVTGVRLVRPSGCVLDMLRTIGVPSV
jgi:hypothetical protein